MMNENHSYTENDLKLIRTMAEQRFSASEIGEKIGVSRNAIIGKCTRLKIQLQSNNRGKPRPNKPKSIDPTPLNRTGLALKIFAKQQDYRVKQPRKNIPSAKQDEQIWTGGLVKIINADDNQCKWPCGDPRSPDFKYCGKFALQGSPYCFDHHCIGYTTKPRQRRTSQEVPSVEQVAHG